jgi:O-antigen/teichoic acid export membrane protein
MTQERRIIKRGILFNYLYLGAGFVWVFLLTPVILRHLGSEEYGFWAILTSVVTYLTMFNFGLNTAVAKYAAEYMAKERRQDLDALVSTTAVAMSILGGVTLLVCFVISPLVPRLFGLSDSLMSTGKIAFIITALNVCVMLLWGIFGNALYGLQRVDLWMLLRTAHLLFCSALIVVFLKLGWGLVGVVSAMTVSHVAMLVGFLTILSRRPYGVRCQYRLASFGMLREIAPFSIRTFVLGLCNCLTNYKDYVLIGLLLGSAMVTPYEVIYKVCFQATYIFSAVSSTLFPKFAEMYAKGDCTRLRNAYMRLAKLSLAIMVPISLCLLICGKTFIGLWVGPENFAGNGVLVALVVMGILHSIGTPTVSVIQSIGRNKLITRSEVVNAVLAVVLSVILLKQYGLVGVALGTLFANLATSTWVLIYSVHKYIGVDVKQYLVRSLIPPMLAGIVTAAVIMILMSVWPLQPTMLGLIVYCLLIVLCYVVTYAFFFTSAGERKLYRGYLNIGVAQQ